MIIKAPCIWPEFCSFEGSGECCACILYQECKIRPNYPMPAIPLAVKYDYTGCVNIDDMTSDDDPIIVWMYDSWTGQNV